ncbi:DUF6650 family protein [Streptomyces sp. NPDC058718]|uniref:DUF6650 family protein n=1 Tax=Streptomyces sp. NPDC058718 TaxID=3346610 RepID=UPI00369C19E2
MKLPEIMRRIKGFSTPFGGLDWEVPVPQRELVARLLVYLEDRRVLTMRRAVLEAVEVPQHCVASVFQIRETLTQFLMDPDTGDELAEQLKTLRAACRRFLNEVGPDHSWSPDASAWQAARFGNALGEFRALFGIQLAVIAAQHKLELPDELRSILPAEDAESDGPEDGD